MICEPVILPFFVREGYRFQPDVCAAAASSVLMCSFRQRNARIPTFGFEGKVTELADVRSDVRVGADVFLQHAGFLTADATFLTNVLPSAATANIDVVLVRFVPATTDKTLRFHLYASAVNHNILLLFDAFKKVTEENMNKDQLQN